MTIEINKRKQKGAAIAKDNNEKAGEMTFSIAGSNLIIIDHTEIEPAYQGKDVGKQLLFKIVEMAREQHIKIIPLCPYASAMFKKTESIRDVLNN